MGVLGLGRLSATVAVKTRSRLISHDKPDMFKQYVWKLPKENTESANNPNSTTSTGTNTSTEACPNTNVGATSSPPKKKQTSTPNKINLQPIR